MVFGLETPGEGEGGRSPRLRDQEGVKDRS